KFRFKPTMSITAGMSPYAGGPGGDVDDSWHDLMGNISVRVTQSELNQNGNHKESETMLTLRPQDHCIEMLRQAVMCNPDTSFTTFVWTHSDPKPVLDVRRFERQCVDWEYFMERVTPRVVTYEEVDELENPMLNSTGQLVS
ncbi:hypothetical protein AOQ84DRAFT_294757, partial [Glonium stellatum]